MSLSFKELDSRLTPIGVLSLRRRREHALGVDVLEIKLGEDYLMSSLFTVSEVALARLGLAALPGAVLDVVVGGLGLGYTAQTVLEDRRVASLVVVEMLEPVIDWHRSALLPLGPGLTSDPRCRLVQGDFFALANGSAGFDPVTPGRRFDAILLDIDHSPRALLNESNATFYNAESLGRMARQLKPGGMFGMWSNEPPDEDFLAVLEAVFVAPEARVVSFFNPFQNREATNTVYLARAAGEPDHD